MNRLSSLAKILALVVPVLVGCSQTDGQGGAYPSLAVIDPIADPDQRADAPLETPRDALERDLRAARAKQIARLETYAAAGQFAMNTDADGLRFVWRDTAGRLCAMADLVSASGRKDLVDRVAHDDNALQLASVTSGELHDWMLHSGLTVEEIQLVQEPGFRVRQQPDLAWEIARKRDHLRAVVERLQADTDRSIAIAVDRLLPPRA